MSGKKLEETLRCAAEIPEFRSALLNNREEAVAKLDLSAAEKSILMSVSREQLEKMIDETKKIPVHRNISLSPVTKLAIGLGIVALAAPHCIPNCIPTRGISPERSHEQIARRGLEQIVNAERLYKEYYGFYGTMDNLTNDPKTKERMEYIVAGPDFYEFTINIDGKTYTAFANRGKQAKTKYSFRVGPDGKIEKFKP